MDNIAIKELSKYLEVWQSGNYRKACHGLDFFKQCRHEMGQFKTVLDIGCGTGRLLKHLIDNGFEAEGVDFAHNALDPDIKDDLIFHHANIWELDLDPVFDIGICADVMEHIPEEKVQDTLSAIHDHCYKVYYVIANYPSKHMGHNLHVTMKPKEWWRENIALQADVREIPISRTGRNEVFAFEAIS